MKRLKGQIEANEGEESLIVAFQTYQDCRVAVRVEERVILGKVDSVQLIEEGGDEERVLTAAFVVKFDDEHAEEARLMDRESLLNVMALFE
mmetsp:Transcript_10274/g.24631  ORF Transcript_10274/g.24631 Transcript_10274/m.24631 type:complete len:91 (+) Transcript_10274:462-734(+)